MSNLIIDIDDKSFEDDVLKSKLPVLVDFWAPWCGPCKSLAPILDEVAPQYEGRVIVAKMNVDESSETPAKHGIRGIPAMMLFKEGEVVGTKVGLVTIEELKLFIDSNIKAEEETKAEEDTKVEDDDHESQDDK
jgi:thioredoxin 1